jgi:SPASM domain peptide maturase of grasp-with-spasm system
MVNKEKYIIRTSHCIFTKGVNRGIILDLQREKFLFVPNDLGDIIDNFENKTIKSVYEHFESQENLDILDQYFSFLIENEFIYLSRNPVSNKFGFKPLTKRIDDPNEIDYAIIDINETTDFSISETIDKLLLIGCKYFQIRLFATPANDFLDELASSISSKEIINIEVILPFEGTQREYDFDSFFLQNQSFSDIYFYNAPVEETLKFYNGVFKVHFKNSGIINSNHCGIVNPVYFGSNSTMYDRARFRNSCLYRKIGIDSFGNIKNCPSMKFDFGNIKSSNLKSIVTSLEFQSIGKIRKDEIKSCKVCEFRYICTDCRAFLESPEDLFSKPLKCGYNPYTTIWEDWTLDFKKKPTIDFYELETTFLKK